MSAFGVELITKSKYNFCLTLFDRYANCYGLGIAGADTLSQ